MFIVNKFPWLIRPTKIKNAKYNLQRSFVNTVGLIALRAYADTNSGALIASQMALLLYLKTKDGLLDLTGALSSSIS